MVRQMINDLRLSEVGLHTPGSESMDWRWIRWGYDIRQRYLTTVLMRTAVVQPTLIKMVMVITLTVGTVMATVF